MSVVLRKFRLRDSSRLCADKRRRCRSKKLLAHKPSGHGIGRWHSRATLWASKQADRRKRLMSNESRRRNRAS